MIYVLYVLLYTSATSDSDAEQRRGCSEHVCIRNHWIVMMWQSYLGWLETSNWAIMNLYTPLYSPYLCYWKRWSLGLYPMETLYKQLETRKQWLHKGIFVATESFAAPCLFFLFSDVGVSFRCCLSPFQSSILKDTPEVSLLSSETGTLHMFPFTIHLSLLWLKRNNYLGQQEHQTTAAFPRWAVGIAEPSQVLSKHAAVPHGQVRCWMYLGDTGGLGSIPFWHCI